jgi:prevent-host-death family protein
MKVTVGVFEAKNKLSGLIDRVLGGDEVWISRHGKPVVMLRVIDPAEAEARPRFGCLEGAIRLGGDFDEPLGDFADYL